tara:strand:- start:328 stop:783 length:456 start_codon:yes stop_codon:yes gene_type:complete
MNNNSNRTIWENEIISISRNNIRKLDKIDLVKNPIIIFDIDNTLIDNFGNCIIPISILYYYAKMIGIKPVIITARKESTRNFTILQLKKNGIHDYSALIMRNEKQHNIYDYKYYERKKLYNLGYSIVMSVGDSDWDIYGGYNGISVKIPIF